MSRPVTLAALTAAVALALAPQAVQAGNHCGGGWKPQPRPFPGHGWEPPAPTATFTNPASFQVQKPAPYVNPQPVVGPRAFYFGMSLQVTHTQFGRGLQVASITPGSPAAQAGLEIGDVLLRAGAVDLQNAYSNEHGVQLLQSAVLGGGAPAPTVAAYTVAPSASVYLTVVNVRTGQLTGVNVQPIATGSPAPTVTAPAPVASLAAPAFGVR